MLTRPDEQASGCKDAEGLPAEQSKIAGVVHHRAAEHQMEGIIRKGQALPGFLGHGDGEAALGSCRDLAKLSPTLENHCRLAEQLLDMGQDEEARVLLDTSLRDYEFAPGPSRRRNRRWASEARRLLKEIAAGE